MSRNSGGTYSLPAGNPVATGTAIAISWANGTLSDIATALTDSLSRTGNGGMLAALPLDSGLIGAPGLTFGAETTLGLYRVGAAKLGVAVSGTKVAEFNASGVTITGTLTPSGVFLGADGAVGAPGYSFAADTDTGIYRVGGNGLGIATGGVLRLTMSSAGAVFVPILSAPVGSAAAPSYTFTGDTDTGMSAATADTLVLGTDGTARLTLTSLKAQFSAPIYARNGDATDVAYGFTNDTDSGLYRVGANSIGFSVGGTLRVTFNDTDLTLAVPLLSKNAASASAPDHSFAGDSNTGIYSPSADEVGFSLGGTGYLVGYRNVPINTQNGDYTGLLTDSGKAIYKASGGAGETFTIPANASVAYPTGTVLTFVNTGGGDLTIAITSDTLTYVGDGSTGSVTLGSPGIATAIKLTSTTWLISGQGITP